MNFAKLLRNVTWGGVNPACSKGFTHVDIKENRMKNKTFTQKSAFTLAEVLITLGIIGVVSAITLPSVIKSYQKQVTVNKLKKIYSTLSQIVTRSYAENGSPFESLSGKTVTVEETKEFFKTYWLPYFNSPNVAEDGKSLYPTTTPYYYLGGDLQPASYDTRYSWGRILFSTADGIIMQASIMEWKNSDAGYYPVFNSVVLVTVDINGLKGPNTLGKDVFSFYVDFKNNKVVGSGNKYSYTGINNDCKTFGNFCIDKIIKDGWKIKDDYPW
jgi:prepilin-type N-terminal cleavage/methylation domain-containing protein